MSLAKTTGNLPNSPRVQTTASEVGADIKSEPVETAADDEDEEDSDRCGCMVCRC